MVEQEASLNDCYKITEKVSKFFAEGSGTVDEILET